MENFSVTIDWANRNLASILLGLISAILILIIGRWVARKLANYASRSMQRAHVDGLVIRFTKQIIYIGLLMAVVIAALNAVGIQTTSLTALLASAGVAIGLGLKDSLSNMASGVMILLFRPYTLNHMIDAGGTSGLVEEVRIYNTVLRTPDNVKVFVPNSSIINSNIKNYSAYENRRIDLVARIRYEDNLGIARDLLLNIMKSHPLVLPEPVPTLDVLELTETGVSLVIRPWARTENYWQVRSDLLEQIRAQFEERGFGKPLLKQEIQVRPPF